MTIEILGDTGRRPWVPDDSTFAARLALVRWRMGWNVKEAATACGIAPSTWRLWEEQDAIPHRQVVVCKTIAARTGCDYRWLLEGEASSDARPAVHRPSGYTEHGTVAGRATYEQNSGMTIRSTRTAYPNRVRPGEHRPVGHSATTTGPPTHRRPARRPRDV